MTNIYIIKKTIKEPEYEFVERKGLGHPDTLADALAEHLSIEYSKYTKDKFGVILHHNFDKVGLLGGSSSVQFGNGKIIKPIRILLNGRASTRFSNTIIPVEELLISWASDFMTKMFPTINPKTDLEFHNNLSNQSSPGKTEEKNSDKGTRKYWFEPRSLDDIQELKELLSNDTSLGVGYAPYSRLESLVLIIEETLNSLQFKKSNPWIGSDIKIMGFRKNNDFHITLCVPQIADYVESTAQYKSHLKSVQSVINKIFSRSKIDNASVYINTRDNFDVSELYLTAIGSSIESGDEGIVGRGNRTNGLITPMRIMSMEGACGKNPVYHIGKIYNIVASNISRKIYKKFGKANEVSLISQSGRKLLDPWIVTVASEIDSSNVNLIETLIKQEIKLIPKITELLLQKKFRLY